MKNFVSRASAPSKSAFVVALLCMVAIASALQVKNSHTASGELVTPFTVSSTANYYNTAVAPTSGNINSIILKILNGDTSNFQQITRHDGACLTQTANLQSSPFSYCLKSDAVITSGNAVACVRSPEIADCCPAGGGN